MSQEVLSNKIFKEARKTHGRTKDLFGKKTIRTDPR
jgi:hypothetical protein